jgi:tripartite-type tricarboxylate transporter receptor subunit TctC
MLGSGMASAQNWPTKPVRIINPFPAGGGTDTFGRPVAARLGQAMGQTFIIENQGGAGGTVGASNAAKAAPDGYTFFLGAVHHTIGESLYTKLPYSLERDFVPITMVALVPQILVVLPKHPFGTMKDFLAYLNANPGKLNFGSAGSGTAHHMAGELFKLRTRTQMVHVPYRGAGPMMQDFLAGQVDALFDGMGTSATQIKAGKAKPIALMAKKRSPAFPDVPTMEEAGLPGLEVSTWYALWALKGTPQGIVDRMYTETAKVMQLQETRDLWTSQSAELGGQPPEQFAAFVKSEIAKWAQVVKESGIKIDL